MFVSLDISSVFKFAVGSGNRYWKWWSKNNAVSQNWKSVHLLDVTFLSLQFVRNFLKGVLSTSEFNSKLGLKSLLISDIKWQCMTVILSTVARVKQ